jgi:hypothetical protein
MPRGVAKSGRKVYNRPYQKTGIHALKRQIAVQGLDVLDRTTPAATALFDWQQSLIGDLGGDREVTTAQRTLVEAATRTKLFIDHLDAWLLQRPSLVLARKRSVMPVVLQRQALVDSLVRILDKLGLHRRAKPVQNLEDYLSETYPGDGGPPSERGSG